MNSILDDIGDPTYRIVVLLGGHVGVAFAPVVGHLLLLLLVEPHQLLGGGQHEGVQLVQVPQAGLGRVLVGGTTQSHCHRSHGHR